MVFALARQAQPFSIRGALLVRLALTGTVMAALLLAVSPVSPWLAAVVATVGFAAAAYALRVVTRGDLAPRPATAMSPASVR